MLELLQRDLFHLDRLARLDELNTLDDHPLPGLEPGLEHSQPLVIVDRDHFHDLNLLGRVDNEDARPFLTLQDRLLRHDDGIDVLTNDHGCLDVLAGQDRAVGVGDLGPHQKGRGLRIDLVVDEQCPANVGMRPFALDGHIDGMPPLPWSAVAMGRFRAGRTQIEPHRVKLLEVDKIRGPSIADQIAKLHL